MVRAFGPRLSFETEYRDCFETRPVDTTFLIVACSRRLGPPAVPPTAVRDIAARAAVAVRLNASPQAMRTVALVDLIWGDTARNSLDRSVSSLEMATRIADRPGALLTDLSAAYLVRAERLQSPGDVLKGIDAAARAVALHPRSAPARFNLALGLEMFGVDDPALTEWSSYLTLDSVSGWAGEARRRAASLSASHAVADEPDAAHGSPAALRAFARRAPGEARAFGWHRLLAEWADAELHGDAPRAARALDDADALGSALEESDGDATLADAARVIRRAAGNASLRRELAHAHQMYARGQARYAAADYAEAGRAFERIVSSAPPSPALRAWADLFLGATLVYRGRAEEGERTIREVAERADTARYPALAGRAYWSLAATLLRRGKHEAGMTAVLRAEELLARIGERESLGAVQALRADQEFVVGDEAGAFASMHRALTTLRPYRGSTWLHNVLYIGAREAAARGLTAAAEQLESEGAAVAERTGRPVFRTAARIARARILADRGRLDSAAHELDRARRSAEELPADARHWFAAESQLVDATGPLRLLPERAAPVLDSAVAVFASLDNPSKLLPTLVARAANALALGDVVTAEEHLDRATALYAERGEEIADARQRASLLGGARDVFDRLVMLDLRQGRVVKALADVERGRTSLARPAVDGRYASGTTLASRAGEVTLDYALVGDTLLAWVISDTAVRLARTTVDRDRLLRTIERARAALELGAAEDVARLELARLHDWMIRPVERSLGSSGSPILVVADAEVAGAPFAALYDSVRGHYLVEDHVVRFAGSLREGSAAAPAAPVPRSALFVSDPAFDPREFPSLDPLPGAADEVRAVAAAYPGAAVLSGPAARRGAVEPALERVALFHFAGHAVFDDERPARSRLALAPAAPGNSGALSADDLYRLDLRRVRLVVLSACSTLRGSRGRAGGFGGFAEALLGAGAGGVVGSLWRVDDRSTKELMVEFHRAYHGSGDAPAALRAAQLRLFHSPDPALRAPGAWAGFRYAGR